MAASCESETERMARLARFALGHGLPALLGLLAMAGLTCGKALGAELSDFFGTYVGNAHETGDSEPMARDMDIEIRPFHDEGFQIHWITVTKVDGRRDVPGVERTVQSVFFEPAEDRNLFAEVEADNPFREREAKIPMSGHAVRWASLRDNRLDVYSFVVLEDGRYEFQIYNRVLTDVGLDIMFRRFDDGELVRQIKGSTVRVEEKP
jgi:hypothetical protein